MQAIDVCPGRFFRYPGTGLRDQAMFLRLTSTKRIEKTVPVVNVATMIACEVDADDEVEVLAIRLMS